MDERLASFFSFQIDAPIYSSLIVMAIILILGTVVGIQAHFADPLKPTHGLLFLAVWGVENLQKWIANTMGDGFEDMAGYFLVLVCYLFVAFIWGLTGLPTIIDSLACSTGLSIIMFAMIHFTAIRYQRWGYFRRYVDPFPMAFPITLPINLVTMWIPIVSTSLRMFGNCLAGTVIIGLVQWSLGSLSTALFGSGLGSIWLAPIPMGILNLYFALFSGFVQTLVFAYLNALWIAQEKPEAEDVLPERAPQTAALAGSK